MKIDGVVDKTDNIDLNWEDEEEEDMAAAGEDEEEKLDLSEDVLVIVHTTGVFHHRVRWCKCAGCPERHIQLLRMSLFSCSIVRPRTVFTFDVLDHFYADAMECKTAGQSFYNKLRRLTNNAFPHTVPVRNFQFSRCHDLIVGVTESPQGTVKDIQTMERFTC